MRIQDLLNPHTKKEIARVVKQARAYIETSKFSPAIAEMYTQRAIEQRIEDAAIRWADSYEPDITEILFELHLLRALRAMLRNLPSKRKKKTNVRHDLVRRRARDRARRAKSGSVVAGGAR